MVTHFLRTFYVPGTQKLVFQKPQLIINEEFYNINSNCHVNVKIFKIMSWSPHTSNAQIFKVIKNIVSGFKKFYIYPCVTEYTFLLRERDLLEAKWCDPARRLLLRSTDNRQRQRFRQAGLLIILLPWLQFNQFTQAYLPKVPFKFHRLFFFYDKIYTNWLGKLK